MHKSIIIPNISAHEQLFGIFDFNCTPFATPGGDILVHENSEIEKNMLLMDQMYGTLAEHRYTTDTSNVTLQESDLI